MKVLLSKVQNLRPFNYHNLFPLKNYNQAHDAQHHCFQPRVLAQQYCYVTNKWDICHDTTNNILSFKILLVMRIENCVVRGVVVAFR